MSQSHNGRNMDRPSESTRRARERALASGRAPALRRPEHDMNEDGPRLNPAPRHHLLPSHPPPPPPPDPPSKNNRRPPIPGPDGRSGHMISRPTQGAQWPLPAGSPLTTSNPEPYRPPPGRPHNPPPRPQRPSRVPSMPDQSEHQEPIPVFLSIQDGEEHNYVSGSPNRLTSSSAGSIPEFPEPAMASPQQATAKRSINLGPPPSSRRGASSYYSHNSFVSPIPEEQHSRSQGSLASSAAIPEPKSWHSVSPLSSPIDTDAYYAESLKSNEDGDESKLVRSASIGKKGKASLVNNKPTRSPSTGSIPIARPSPTPVQKPFDNGTAYLDTSTSSSDSALPHKKKLPPTPDGARNISEAGPSGTRAANAEDYMPSPRMGQSTQPGSSRLSNMRRPPKLDIDAVRTMEARGSMTSLPDLIQRATRLVAMIDKGKRPASRLDNLGDFDRSGRGNDGSGNDRVVSSLSDMLNAFPPPAQPTPTGRQSRASWFRHTAWPKAEDGQDFRKGEYPEKGDDRPARRCCGMPPWVFVIVVLLLLAIVAVAVVIPLQFFVFKNLGNHPKPEASLDKCRSELTCKNGGTNVFTNGTCACVCTNGYTGRDCSTEGAESCTTTNLVSSTSSSMIENVTLGSAIPRLILEANHNFSIPLSGTAILASFNSGDFSCRSQNSLVTFQGQSTRVGESSTSKIQDISDDDLSSTKANVARAETTATAEAATRTAPTNELIITDTLPTASPTHTPQASSSGDQYNVTEDSLDFARVAVLYILQQKNTTVATDAQSYLQRFFTRASGTEISVTKATKQEASKVNLGWNSTINLVAFNLDIGNGTIGK